MSEPQQARARRILLALASGEDAAALAAAAVLAERLRSRVEGLLLQDPELARLATLPFAQEVALYTATARPLAADQVQRDLRAQAAAVERLLRKRFGTRVQWSFSVAYARSPSSYLRAEPRADLYVLGRPPSRHALPHATPGGPLVSVYDGSNSGTRALHYAAELVHRGNGELLVLLAATDAAGRERLLEQAQHTLRDEAALTYYLPLPADGLQRLEHIARAQHASLLLLGSEELPRDPQVLERLVTGAPCPLIVAD